MGMLRTVFDREVTARLLDHGMSGVDPVRAELLSGLGGRIVEIGLGSGANLPFYPSSVRELVAVEPSEGLAQRARPRLDRWADERGSRTELVLASASRPLPLDAASFDAVVLTFVLCSVRDIGAVLGEAARLLRPGAPLVLAEHVAAAGGAKLALQRAVRPVWRAALGGCDPARETRRALRESGWDDRGIRDVTLALPYVVSSGIVGSARR